MSFFTTTQVLRDRRWPGYILGLLAVSLSLAVRVALGDVALKFPFVIFLPPVVLTTFVGGVGPGIATGALAGLVADVTLIAPAGALLPTSDGWIALAFYAATVGTDIALIHAMTNATSRANAAETALRGVNEDLERRVAERTFDLKQQIAERETAEAQVWQLQKIESIGQLTGGIAHDFNNMLAVIIGSLEMARRRLGDPDRLMRSIDSAEEGAKRAAQLVARLLAFSRQQALEPRALDANQLVGGMTEMLKRTLGEQVRVETILTSTWRSFADAMQVENAILNLSVNARDAMPDGGKLTIETANRQIDARQARGRPDLTPGEYVMIKVVDTGTGMPPKVMERAFDPFYTTKGVGKGTGLGLSQVYGFVRQSGGHVTIQSEIGAGTTIELFLPRQQGTEPLGDDDAQAARAAIARGDEIVLVVEDEAGVRQMSVDALRELGYTVIQAADAKQALSTLAIQPRIDLLFTDIVMPEMNGRQLAQAALAIRPMLKVIFTTGYASSTVIPAVTAEPGVALLPKPFSLSALATKVREVLDDAAALTPRSGI